MVRQILKATIRKKFYLKVKNNSSCNSHTVITAHVRSDQSALLFVSMFGSMKQKLS